MGRIYEEDSGRSFTWHKMLDKQNGYFCVCNHITDEEPVVTIFTELINENVYRQAIFSEGPDLGGGLDIAYWPHWKRREMFTGKFQKSIKVFGGPFL